MRSDIGGNEAEVNYDDDVVPNVRLRVMIDDSAPPVPTRRRPVRSPEEGYDHKLFVMENKEARLRTILDSIIEKRATLLRAPPGSGKTTFGEVVGEYAATQGMKIVDIFGTETFDSFEKIWDSVTGGDDWNLVTQINEPTLVIIDEAQTLYDMAKFHSLWIMVKKLLTKNSPVCFLFLATYGAEAVLQVSPISFDYEFGLRSLRLRPSEAKSLAQKYADWHGGMTLTEDIVEGLYNLSGGYAGIFRYALYVLRKDRFITSSQPGYLLSHSFRRQLFHSRPFLWVTDLPLQSNSELRGLTRQAILECNKELRLSLGLGDLRFQTFVRNGILVQEDKFSLQFSSPIIFDVMLRALMTTGIYPEPTVASFEAVLTEILRRIDGRRISQNAELRPDPLEDAWQKQFYVAATSTINIRDGIVVTEAGYRFGHADAFMDFYLDGNLQWGVELTREGSRLEEHVSRFTTGRYASFGLKNWVVIDFRRTTPNLTTLCDNVWYVVYADDFSTFTMYRANEQPTVIVTYVSKA